MLINTLSASVAVDPAVLPPRPATIPLPASTPAADMLAAQMARLNVAATQPAHAPVPLQWHRAKHIDVLGDQRVVSFRFDQDANALRLHSGMLDAAITALDSDSRFHVVTSPNLRVYSGKHGRLNVGQSVPVISSVSYPGSSGAPVQSVDYQDAGVIFDVVPTVKGDITDADVTVEISDFEKTSTGVNS